MFWNSKPLLVALALLVGLPVVGCGDSKNDRSDSSDDDDSSRKKKKKKKSDDEDDDDDSKKSKKRKKGDEEAAEKPDAVAPATGTPPTTPPPLPTEPPSNEVQFAGIYRSTFGDVRLRQQPGSVEGTYPGGTLKCVPSGPVLDCDWKEGTATGKARLAREATGDLIGTWGNGLSNASGGAWRFNLLSAGDPGPSGLEATAGSFAGEYTSTFGVVTLVEAQDRVTGRYPGGTLDCAPAGAVLACGWREGTLTGRAKLTRQMNGDLSGTWGSGASDSSGGPWLFRRR